MEITYSGFDIHQLLVKKRAEKKNKEVRRENIGGGVAQLVERWLQEQYQVPTCRVRFLNDILGFIVSVPLLARLESVIVIVRWHLARPGHLWECGYYLIKYNHITPDFSTS